MTGEIWSQTSTHVECVSTIVTTGHAGIFTKAAKCNKGIFLIEY